jgi:UDP-N-acetylmuramate dehydrogenase
LFDLNLFDGIAEKIFDADLNTLTTVKTGGKAKVLLSPQSKEQLIEILKTVKQNNLPFFILGKGSNVLASDKGFNGVVIKPGRFLSQIFFENDLVVAEAGATTAMLANFAMQYGLTGVEFLSTIPASVGGAVAMNAGCFGYTVGEKVEKVVAVDEKGEHVFYANQLMFDYRTSIFQDNGMVITKVYFKLVPSDTKEVEKTMAKLLSLKRSLQPLDFPSFGSVFKRHEGISPAIMIDKLGFKGFAVGGAKVSEKHAGFFVNTGKATTEDFLTLINIVGNKVYEVYGVKLETEVKYLGDTDDLGRLSYSYGI